MAFSNPSLSLLSSSCSVCNRLNPLLFSTQRRRRISLSRSHFRSRCFTTVAGMQSSDVFTSPEVAKSFDFTAEERIYKWWESQGYFKPSFERGSEPFVVSMPPPNVTGSLHMGHAMFVTLEDIMVRYHRMKGRPTLWLPGTDHAGIATQLVVERMLAAEGTKRVDLGREEFTKRVWAWKEKYGGTITNQIKRLGASCDWTKERFTLDAQLSRAVVEAFVRLHEKGLIYQGSYVVNWSPNLQTAVSDLEVEYSEEPGTLYHIKYRVAGGSRSDYLTIATTRPETLFGDTAVAVNPEDERYSKYVGKQAIVPMTYGRHVPIISDKYVDKDFGTGVLKISPGHDHNDYLLARKLGLPILNVMNKDGTLNEVAGLYCGLDRFEARKKLWSELEETGLAVKKEPHTLRVPRSQRGGEIIEPLVSKQWFVTMEPLAEKALQAVEKGELTIMPERFEKIYNHWLSNIKDWCISRQLWWGHRIPVWYIVGKDCEEEYIVARSTEEALAKAREKYGRNVEIYQDPDVLDTWFSRIRHAFVRNGIADATGGVRSRMVRAGCGVHCGLSALLVGQMCQQRTLRNSIPLQFLRPDNRAAAAPYEQARHIVLLGGKNGDDGDRIHWDSSIFKCLSSWTYPRFSNPCCANKLIASIICKSCWVLFNICSMGRKMSKTLGNVIDPLDTIKEYGTDALRFTLSLGTPGQDLNLSLERLNSNKGFTNKLWNAGKFVLHNLPPQSDLSAWKAIQGFKPIICSVFSQFDMDDSLYKLPLPECWVVSKLHILIDAVTTSYDKYFFGDVAREIYDFFWGDFADWYIEASKARLYHSGGDSVASVAQAVLLYVFGNILKLLHPFMPFVTEELWQSLPYREEALIVSAWPLTSLPTQAESVKKFENLQSLTRAIRNARAEYSVEPARRISASIVANSEVIHYISKEREVLALLSRLDLQNISFTETPPGDANQSVHLVASEGLEAYLPLADMVDISAEVQRLSKRLAKMQNEYDGLMARLSSPSFVEKAPKDVVRGVQEKAAEAEEKLILTRNRLAFLQSTVLVSN
ncbi:hypothetical protein BUALT_Bualt02G0092400 [Buddleja alternifolia]|uniref:valine--tRNA ligase n=1 Tax=Buddleja alternifolia TaxID=168488 RepID=A0AAV6Y6R2_9LAMI|nr:hypothetical protein BUALT_Bualt02G0092400 [Buddleja alternifolia]